MQAPFVLPLQLLQPPEGKYSTKNNYGPTDSAEAEGGPLLSSGDLLQGRKTVSIAHNGFIYRLQATRLGKLILTK